MAEINSKKRLLQKEIMRLHSEMSTNLSRYYKDLTMSLARESIESNDVLPSQASKWPKQHNLSYFNPQSN